MSSIERAMDKISGAVRGEDEDPPPAVAEKEVVAGRDEDATTADARPGAAPQEGTTDEAADVQVLSPEPDPPGEAAVAVASPGGPQPDAAPPAMRPAALDPPRGEDGTKPAEDARPAKNYVTLDVERLAAAGMLVPDQPTTRISEEYQRIKRRLLGNLVPGMLSPERPPNLILITSSVPGEGKTFTSVNLSISIAMEVDHTVLAIDSDIVKRDLSKAFGVEGRVGLYDLLSDSSLRLEDLLVRTSMPNLVVLPAGANREGSTELLASLRMKELAAEISQRYADRVVIFDSPPILATTTATALAPLMGQVLLVAEAGNTKQETVKESLQRLDHVRITGLILNKSKQVVAKGYDYYGYYHPGAE